MTNISRIFLSLPLMFTIGLGLSSCTNLSKTGIATTVGTSATALIATQNPLVASGVAVAGLGVDYVVNEPNDAEEAISKLETLPIGERGAYLKSMAFWKAFRDLGYFGIGAVFIFFMVPYLLGYLVPTRRRRRLERAVFNHPEIKSDDLK